MLCKICGAPAQLYFTRTVLNRHEVSYFYCASCGFLQTEEPYWLDEAYQNAIANTDTGLVYRNELFSRLASVLFFYTLPRDGKFVDAGGGYGMFVRLMRDIGFDFYWTDIFCQNLLARGFEADTTKPPFVAVTAFEVMEHTPTPMQFIRDTMNRYGSRTLLFSTETFEGEPPAPDAWWYYSFATGQHISFYQRRTLKAIATQLGLHCYSKGMLHMITDRKIHPLVFRLLTTQRVASLLSFVVRRSMRGRMMTDHEVIMARGNT
jgi:hypothetical protein